MTENGAAASPYRITLQGDGISIDMGIDGPTALDVAARLLGGSGTTTAAPRRVRRGAKQGAGARSRAPRSARRQSGSPGIVKDISLHPAGKTAFVDFTKEKQPKNHKQKQVVAVFWLREEAGLSSGITADHVNTCYVEAGWSRPKNLDNALQVTATLKGWLDTSDMADIKLTTRGEDEVRHNLPPQPKGRPR